MPEDRSHLMWKERRRERIYDARIFEVERVERESADGRTAEFALISSPDWVQVVATTRNPEGRECFVLVRQFRQGARRLTIELPGGMVDDGEDPEDAARRELKEETGFTADRLIRVGSVSPNPAIMDNTAYTFVAPEARLVAEQDLDVNEIVDAELVPVEELTPERHPEFFVHAIMVTALYWYERWKKKGADGIRTRE
ncbi:MAG: NUDIX hydrolase [Spirochaetaceae bacterium]